MADVVTVVEETVAIVADVVTVTVVEEHWLML